MAIFELIFRKTHFELTIMRIICERYWYIAFSLSAILFLIFLFRKFKAKKALLILGYTFMVAGAILGSTEFILFKGVSFLLGISLVVVSHLITKKEEKRA